MGVGAVGLRRIAVDQRPQVHRMGGAAHLVLDGEKMPAVGGVDDLSKAILILIVLARDQAALQQPAVRAGKVRDVDLHVVAVEIRLLSVSLAELQILLLADLYSRYRSVTVL